MSLSKEKRNTTLRKIEQVERMKNDLATASRAEELQRLELSKRIDDDKSRIKSFSDVHDRICAETTQCAKQLSDVEIDGARLDSRLVELETGLCELSEESTGKMHALSLATKQHCHAQEVRARKRTERCNKSSLLTEAIQDTQRHQSMIEKLTCTLHNAEKEVEQAKGQVEQGKRKGESIASQLRSRYGELETLQRDLQRIDEDRRRGELLVQTKEKELERLHLKVRNEAGWSLFNKHTYYSSTIIRNRT